MGHFWEKITKWHIYIASKEDIWPQNFLNSMQGLKSTVLAIFQRGPGWSCPVSAGLNNPSVDLKLHWVSMNSLQCWKAKLERALFLWFNLVK